MALMERVATLLRANIHELLDRSTDPEKLGRQLVLDMENQLLQVKTQVAMALADQHMLERKRSEQQDAVNGWRRKAELAVGKGDNELARAALERSLSHTRLLQSFTSQVNEQTAEAEALRSTFLKLQGKLGETRGQCELLIAQHRRARLQRELGARQLSEAGSEAAASGSRSISRLQSRVEDVQAQSKAIHRVVKEASLEERLAQIETEDHIEQLLTELKAKSRLLPTP